ncbi:MAG: hypothetical protein ACTHM2_13125 [Afipia sp.]
MAKPARAVAVSVVPFALRWLFVAALMGAAVSAVLVFAKGAQAGAAFDGIWRVTIITQSGNCDPAYSYPLKVVDGRISYAGDGSFEISGNVGAGGGVSVAIARGDQKASASGKLSGTSGSGHWSGKSSSTACKGRWEAVRS